MLTLKEDTMLGNIPSDWKSRPLKSLLAQHYPGDWGDDRGPNMVKTLRSTNLTNDGPLDLNDIALRALPQDKAENLTPRRNDILLERSGGGPGQPVGRVGFVEADMPGHTFSNFLHLLRPNPEEINARFLGWVLYRVNRTGRIIRLEQQTTQMRNLHFRDYLTMLIPVPPPPEQDAIARVIEAVDAALKRSHAALQEVKKLKSAALQQFFFAALGKTAYADRPRRRLPKGWSLASTETLLAQEPKNGASPTATSQPPGTPTFSIAAVRDGLVNLDDQDNLKYVQLSQEAADKFRIRRGDVLIVRGNANPDLVGKAGMINSLPEGCIYPDITKRVVFRAEGTPTVTPAFAVLAWNHPIVHNQVLRRAKTSNGTLKINSRDVKQIIMPVPPPEAQAEIVQLTAAVDAKVSALQQVITAQEALKKSLMHDLLTGRVRVNPRNQKE